MSHDSHVISESAVATVMYIKKLYLLPVRIGDMEDRKKEMSSISREKDDTFKVFKAITDNCLHLHLYSKLLVFIHIYLGHLSLKLCHRVLEI